MFHRILVLPLFLVAVPLSAAAQTDPDDRAKAAVQQFMKAFKAKDLDGVMATVTTPWYHKGEKIIRNRDELRQAFQGLFEKKKDDLEELHYEIKTVIAYDAVREAMNDQERQLIDQVLTKTDRVLLIQIEKPKMREIVVLMVSLKQGEAKVVGLKS